MLRGGTVPGKGRTIKSKMYTHIHTCGCVGVDTRENERGKAMTHGFIMDYSRKVQKLRVARCSWSSLFIQNRSVPVLYPGTTFTFDFYSSVFFSSLCSRVNPRSFPSHFIPFIRTTLVHINEVARPERTRRIAPSSSSGVIGRDLDRHSHQKGENRARDF